MFATARAGEHGASVEWGDADGTLAIDAPYLRGLADQQRPRG
jgi:hypothetical protein